MKAQKETREEKCEENNREAGGGGSNRWKTGHVARPDYKTAGTDLKPD